MQYHATEVHNNCPIVVSIKTSALHMQSARKVARYGTTALHSNSSHPSWNQQFLILSIFDSKQSRYLQVLQALFSDKGRVLAKTS